MPFLFFIFFITSFFSSSENLAAQSIESSFHSKTIMLSEGWEYLPGTSQSTQGLTLPPTAELWTPVTLPCLSKGPSTDIDASWFRVKLPTAASMNLLGRDPAVFIRILDQAFSVFLGDTLIYSYGVVEKDGISKFQGYPWHFISLPDDFQSKYLTFFIHRSDRVPGICGEVVLGSKSSLIYDIISQNIDRLIVSLAATIIALLALFIAVSTKERRPYLSFAAFTIDLAAWIMTNAGNPVKQLMLDTPLFWAYVDLFSLYLFPVFIITFCEDLFGKRYSRTMWTVKWCHIVFAGTVLLMTAFDMTSINRTLFYFNLIAPFSVILFGISSVRLVFQKKEYARYFALAMLTLFLFLIHDWLIGFGFMLWKKHLLHWGLFCFIIALSAILVKRFVAIMLVGREAEKTAAIARTTQMLAHDVRKPFTLLRMGLGVLQSASTPEKVAGVLARLIPEVETSISSVNGLLQDIMEMGSTADPMKEPVSPESLIEASLNEIFRLRQGSEIEISYDFKHTHMIDVDSLKVLRVFSNIIDNAVQAMKLKGSLLIKTREIYVGKNGFTQFTIGNNGPAIPEEDLPKIFDAFFTKGKKGGTGLGLAIAQKIVVAHGGTIFCTVNLTKETEFCFTLPIAKDSLNQTTSKLPKHSKDVAISLIEPHQTTGHENAVLPAIQNNALSIKNEDFYESKIKDHLSQKENPLTLLLIDDESLYLCALKAEAKKGPLQPFIKIITAKNSNEALNHLNAHSPEVVICDIDLGPESLDGFQLVKAMRNAGIRATICIHSNRCLPEDFKMSLDAGANYFLPKPMTRSHLLRLLLGSLEKDAAKRTNEKNLVAVVEDNPFILDAWRKKLSDENCLLFSSSEEFFAKHDADPKFTLRLLCVVTDYYFNETSDTNGIEFASKVKEMCPLLPIFLSSDAVFTDDQITGIDHVISKVPLSLDELKNLVFKL